MKHSCVPKCSRHRPGNGRGNAASVPSGRRQPVCSGSPANRYSNSNHANRRMRQRGLRKADLELITQFGSIIDDGFILRRKDAEAAKCEMKRTIADLDRLAGVAVITKSDTVVTYYRPTKSKRRRMLQKANLT